MNAGVDQLVHDCVVLLEVYSITIQASGILTLLPLPLSIAWGA